MNGQRNGRSVVQHGGNLQQLAEARMETRLRFNQAVHQLLSAAQDLSRSDYAYVETMEERLRAAGGRQ